jgi:hypothetical protein
MRYVEVNMLPSSPCKKTKKQRVCFFFLGGGVGRRGGLFRES